MFKNLVTKDQLENLLTAWDCQQSIPTKKTKIVLSFPSGSQYNCGLVTWTNKKTPNAKKRLFMVILGNSIEEVNTEMEKVKKILDS